MVVSEFVENKICSYMKEVKQFPGDFYILYRYEVPEAFTREVRRCLDER